MSDAAFKNQDPIALIYLARGADSDHVARFQRFLSSYKRFSAGMDHTLFIIFKGFDNATHLAEGQEVFRSLDYHTLFTSDDSFDLGAYIEASHCISHKRVCFLNSNSEIASDGWLAKLAVNFALPHVGAVSATGSFESLSSLGDSFPRFPNPHIRSNAFMIQRDIFIDMLAGIKLKSKRDVYSIESGENSVTRRIFERGLTALVVGRDGRGYTPSWWPHSQTFRQGSQSNLLIHDNQTRMFENLSFEDKRQMSNLAWGEYCRMEKRL